MNVPIPFEAFARAFLGRELGDVVRALTYQQSAQFREPYDRFHQLTQLRETPDTCTPLILLMNYVVSTEFELAGRDTPDVVPLHFTSTTGTHPIGASAGSRKPGICGVQRPGDVVWEIISVACEYKHPRWNSTTPVDTVAPLPLSEQSSSTSQPDQSGHLDDPSVNSSQPCGSRSNPSDRCVTSPTLSSCGSSDLPVERHVKLDRCLLKMRSHQATRDGVLGILFTGSSASFWYADSDSTLKSEPVKVDSTDFISALMCLARADPKQLGYSPHFRTADNTILTNQPLETARFFMDENAATDTAYQLMDAISPAHALHGRCSRVLGALLPDSQEQCVLKLSYQVVTHEDEAELLGHARDRQVAGIVRIYTSFRLKKLSEGPRSRLPPGLSVRMNDYLLVEDRELRVLVLARCMPLYRVSDPYNFLAASVSLLNTICDLYDKGNILHRDISVNNLMVDINDQSKGVLIDLDHGVDLRENGEKAASSLHRTGTLPFMALDLLDDHDDHYAHYLRHDLESFVYVLYWIAARYESGEEVNKAAFNNWCDGGWKDIRLRKYAFLSGLNFHIDPKPTPTFLFLSVALRQLQDILFAAHSQIIMARASQFAMSRANQNDLRYHHGADYPITTSPSPPRYPVDLEGVNRASFTFILTQAFNRLPPRPLGLSVHA